MNRAEFANILHPFDATDVLRSLHKQALYPALPLSRALTSHSGASQRSFSHPGGHLAAGGAAAECFPESTTLTKVSHVSPNDSSEPSSTTLSDLTVATLLARSYPQALKRWEGMDRAVASPIFAMSLFLGMLLILEVGRRMAIRERAKGSDQDPRGIGAVEGAVFALFGLLLAFTFSGAVERFDKHRELIAEETNAIGTAYLRLDLLPTNAQPTLRELFGKYLDARLEVYRKLPDIEAAQAALTTSTHLQEEIWIQAVDASRLTDSHPDAAKLLLPALNTMIDITTTREMAANLHPPAIIFILLFAFALACSLLAGYGMATSPRSWPHILGFAVVTVITVFVVLDIEYPRQGLFRADAYDQALIDLREGMK
jgi:hypothetical protein